MASESFRNECRRHCQEYLGRKGYVVALDRIAYVPGDTEYGVPDVVEVDGLNPGVWLATRPSGPFTVADGVTVHFHRPDGAGQCAVCGQGESGHVPAVDEKSVI